MSTTVGEESSAYIHGSSLEEQHRLSLLNTLLNERSLQELKLAAGERVLDVGSGLGQFTRAMARAVSSSGYVLGIERDEVQLARAVHLAEEDDEINLVQFRQGDATELSLEEDEWGSFDVAHTRFLLEHLVNPLAVVSAMIRALKPGGRIILADDDHESFLPWPEPAGFKSLWHAYLRSYDRLGNDPYIGRRLVGLLYEAGLREIQNTCIFFGGCAGNASFEAAADNLIGVLEGAREHIISNALLDELSFSIGIEGLNRWKEHPSAALWYTVFWAEGRTKD